MVDAYMGDTELGATKAVLISNLVQKELAFAAKLRGTVTDVSGYARPGLKQISFPKLTSFTVADRVEGVLGAASALTSSVDTMNLDFNAYVSWIIDSFTARQSSIAAQMESIKFASQAMARYVDEQIIVKLAASAASFQNVGADVNVTFANLLAMRQAILKANGDLSKTVILASPAQESSILNLAEFKNFYQYGNPVVPSGVVGQILGMNVIVHNGLADKQLFVYEQSSIAVGFQKEAQYGSQPMIEMGVGAERSAIDMYFGVVALQQGLQGAAAGKSPLIIGLND